MLELQGCKYRAEIFFLNYRSVGVSVPLYWQNHMSQRTQSTDQDPALRWQQWIDEHADVFFLYARQQTRCEADAEDVLQEALVEIWSKAQDEVPPRAVVFATIRRRAIDLGRSMDRRARRENEVSHDNNWFVSDVGVCDVNDMIQREMANLPDDLREVLILRVWGEMTFPAIAQLLAIPVATATSRYRYAVERLKPNLTELQP
jgi:RNA polymerase sigma-70 factor (ECF subfamily)